MLADIALAAMADTERREHSARRQLVENRNLAAGRRARPATILHPRIELGTFRVLGGRHNH